MLTAHVGTGLASLTADHGFDAIVAKPVSRARVLQILDAVVVAASIDPSAEQESTPNAARVSYASDLKTPQSLSSGPDSEDTNSKMGRAPLLSNLFRAAWRRIWTPPCTDPVQQWRYRGCVLVVLFNILALLLMLVLRLNHVGPLHLNRLAFGLGTLAFALLTILIRYTSNPRVLLPPVLVLQAIFTVYTVYVCKQPLGTATAFVLNVITNQPFRHGAYSAAVVAVCGVLSVYLRGTPFFSTHVPTKEETLSVLSFDMYLLGTLTLFVLYLLKSRARAVSAVEQAQRDAVADAHATTARKAAAERFISSLSFDLRTPLNVVLAVAERLSEITELNKITTRRVNIIQSAAHLLLTLISNMVDIRSLETQAVTAAAGVSDGLRTMDVGECVRRIGRILVFYAHRKKLRLVLRISKDVPATVTGSALRLQQILMNLVSNAIKYTSKGEVTLQVDTVDERKFDESPVFALRLVDRGDEHLVQGSVRPRAVDTPSLPSAHGENDSAASPQADRLEELRSPAGPISVSAAAAAGAAAMVSSSGDTDAFEVETTDEDQDRAFFCFFFFIDRYFIYFILCFKVRRKRHDFNLYAPLLGGFLLYFCHSASLMCCIR